MARAIWFSIQTFRFSFVNGKYPPSQGQSCYFEPFLFSPNEHMKQKMKQKNNEPRPRVCVFLTSLWEQLQKRLRRITLCRYSKYVHSKLKTKATKIKKVREFWWTIVYSLLLYRIKKLHRDYSHWQILSSVCQLRNHVTLLLSHQP